MKPGTLQIVQATLSNDDSIPATDRQAILDFCKHPSTAPQPRPRPLTVPDLCERWGYDARTVYRYMGSGTLPFHYVGGRRRVHVSDVEAFEARPHVKRKIGRRKPTIAAERLRIAGMAGMRAGKN